MKDFNINKKITSLVLASTIALSGCSFANNRKEIEQPLTSTTKTVDVKYDIPNGVKVLTIKTTTTKGDETHTTVSTKTEDMQLCEYDITRIIAKEEINIRKEPEIDSTIIKTIPEGVVLQSVYNDGEWYRVIIDGEIGYVNSEYVYAAVDKSGKEITKETVNRDDLEIEKTTYVEANESVNVRSDATAESNRVGLLEAGQRAEALKLLNNGWYEINYNGKRSYVSGEYVKEVTEDRIISPFTKKVMFTNDANIYSNKERTEVVDIVPTYEVGFVYSETDDMYLANVNDRLVYINKYDTTQIADKLVIVDLSDQNAKLWDGNSILVDTPVVTGKPSTPTYEGYFEIYMKERNALLMNEYFVDYWEPFDEGRGLHDAEYHTEYDEYGNAINEHGWRYYESFGGNTYQWGGSHGCVNMPNQAAKKIYENTEVGNKVLVKK